MHHYILFVYVNSNYLFNNKFANIDKITSLYQDRISFWNIKDYKIPKNTIPIFTIPKIIIQIFTIQIFTIQIFTIQIFMIPIFAIHKNMIPNSKISPICIQESFNINISHKLFDYKITYVNSHHENINCILKNWF